MRAFEGTTGALVDGLYITLLVDLVYFILWFGQINIAWQQDTIRFLGVYYIIMLWTIYIYEATFTQYNLAICFFQCHNNIYMFFCVCYIYSFGLNVMCCLIMIIVFRVELDQLFM